MSSDLEDVILFPADENRANKRSVYEPTNVQRCQQLVLRRAKAIAIVVCAIVFILLIALIAAFARPYSNCSTPEENHIGDGNKVNNNFLDTEGREYPWKDIRLPKIIVPKSYWIHMHPNLTTFCYNGTVDIVLQVTEPANFLVLHSKKLNISNIIFYKTGVKQEHIKINIVQEYVAFEQIYIGLSSQLQPNNNYTLSIQFNSLLLSQLYGFYKSSYKTKNNEVRYLATTQFEPTDARAAFPCFDEPAHKSTFKLSMVREARHLTLFNTPLASSTSTLDEYRLDEFKESVSMSTYLVAFVVCDYGFVSKNSSHGVKVSVYAPEELLDQVDFALQAAINMIDYYTVYFGVPYPLPKQDLIAIPDFAAGAMENWGLITYRMTRLLHDNQEGSEENKQNVAAVVAHELAHQWFGNLVTMEWWNDLWLNEGFASFVQYLGTDHFEPDWEMPDQFVTETMTGALQMDSLSSSHPISVVVNNPGEISEIFDHISYRKGSSIIRMLEDTIGNRTLQEGLQFYLNQHKFQNADTDDLWTALSNKTNGINVKAVMDTWTRQMGYPVVTVARSGDRVKVTQQRFLLNPRGNQSTEFSSPYGYVWRVPLRYITSNSPDKASEVVWLSDREEKSITLFRPTWIKFNYCMKGFYRVNYDSETWKELSRQLQNNHEMFTSVDRANLIDDAFALSSSGLLNITVALDLTRYLVKEQEFTPWKVALDNFRYIQSLLEDNPAFEFYRKYIISILSDTLDKLGWSTGGSYLEQKLRVLLLHTSVSLNHKPTIEKAVALFKSWMTNKTQIEPSMRVLVYQVGVQLGGDADWQFVWQQSQTTDVPSEKHTLMYALTCTKDMLQLKKYLKMSLDDSLIRKTDTSGVLAQVAENPVGRDLTWRFIRQNWQLLKQRYDGITFTLGGIIAKTVNLFSTQYDYDEVKAFFNEHDTDTGRRTVSQALESIENNIDWLARNEQTCVEWLKNQ